MTNLFFIVVTPQFERLALYELQAKLAAQKFPLSDYEIHPGGIELTLPRDIGLSLNAVLKIPTRILMRLETKEILSFKELENFFKSIDWKAFGPLREVYVSSRSSKMKMKDAIKESFKKVIPFKPQKTGTDVYIRVFRDQCTVSVDTSGEDLFMRGYEKWVGEAPIRDTMAAGLLQLALQGVDDFGKWEVIDPMMGSGTFISEALLMKKISVRPFCYQNWQKSEKLKTPESVIDTLTVRGRDKDKKNVEIAKKNFLSLGRKDVDLKTEDLLEGSQVLPKDKNRLVILNPPYGKRLAIKDKNFFQNIIESAEKKYAPERFGMIVPRGVDVNHPRYEKVRHFPFSNNGIDVEFLLFLKR